MKNPVLWTLLSTATVICLILIASIPVVGDPLATLLFPVLLAGFMLGCSALQRGEELKFAYLFAGFQQRPHQLIALGGINFVCVLLIMEVMKIAGGENLVDLIMTGTSSDDPSVFAQAVTDSGFSIIIGMPLYVVLVMAMQFAPALVLFNNAAPLEALKASLQACLRNILPLAVYGAIMMLFAAIAMIPYMLGWLVLLPIMLAATYSAYRDIFPALQESARDAGKESAGT